jgi:excinuclease ABC subunit B
MNLLRDLRKGVFDVLVGINLLREGLDLPEVSLVAILDADKEGFLRSERALVQTIGRAARNSEGRVILYADKMTDSMKGAIDETNRRRAIQHAHNVEHGITPQTIIKRIHDLEEHVPDHQVADSAHEALLEKKIEGMSAAQLDERIVELRGAMRDAASELQFERASELRDEMLKLEKTRLAM